MSLINTTAKTTVNIRGEHKAGQDLTEFLEFAPHGEEVLERYPVVDELID